MLNKYVLGHKIMILDFLNQLGIDITLIKQESIMLTAFVHKSFASDFSDHINDNERLEFLGDSVLSLIINTKLFENFPEDTEAHLTMRKISLVRQEHLAQVALEIGLDKAVLIGRGEEKMGGRNKESVLTDTLEAIIGWMYLDLGRSHTQEFVLKYVYRNIGYGSLSLKSYKSLIQEYFQKLHNIPPVYEDIAHEIDQYGNVRTFKSIISCNGIIGPAGYGSNKKKAQESAAKLRYEELTT